MIAWQLRGFRAASARHLRGICAAAARERGAAETRGWSAALDRESGKMPLAKLTAPAM
ncbi:MAG: hypothetical protein LKG16_07430 [Bifidobacterium subtile]|nr:hypothetical protein [Bifidobacterium subtile]